MSTVPTVEIYTTAICPYCVSAKQFFQNKGLAFQEIRVDQNPEKFSEMLTRSNNLRTVPQIFINDQHIGGYDDLIAANRAGTLII